MNRRSRFTVLVAMLSAMFLAIPAWASSGITINSFSHTASGANVAVGTTTKAETTMNYDWLIINLGGGIEVTAEAAGTIADDELVGEVKLTARLQQAACIRTTHTLPARWVSPLSGNGPSGTISELRLVAAFGNDISAYVVVDSNGDHSIHVDASGTTACSWDLKASITAETDSHSGTSGSVVATSSASGNYTLTTTVVPSSGSSHSDTEPYTIP